MFDKEYSFYGKHAKMVKELTSPFSEGNRLFTRNVDVYIFAPIIGYLYQRRAALDPDRSNDTKIFPDVIFKEKEKMKFVFQTVQLLERKNKTTEDKLNASFRYYGQDANQENELAYEAYVLGGVEVLHEKLVEGASDPSSYLMRLMEFMNDFHSHYYQESGTDIDYDFFDMPQN